MLVGSPLRSPLVGPLGSVLGTGLPWESGGGGVAVAPPVNTVAPVASGTVTIGGTLTTTDGTWTGTPSPTFTYQWQRGATIDGVGSYANIGSATASTYTPVAADMGYSLRCVVTGTNAAGAASANSNALRYDPKALYRSVYDSASAGGFIDDVGTSGANDLTASGNPAHSASDAAFNGQPSDTADGTGDFWTKSSASMGGTVNSLTVLMVQALGSFTAGDVWVQYGAGGVDVRLRVLAGPVMQLTGAGTGIAVSTSTTNLSGAKLMGFDWTNNSTQHVFYKTTAEDTDSNTVAAGIADSGTLTIAAQAGGPTDIACSFALVIVHPAILSAGALADVGAYCTNRFGAGVGS